MLFQKKATALQIIEQKKEAAKIKFLLLRIDRINISRRSKNCLCHGKWMWPNKKQKKPPQCVFVWEAVMLTKKILLNIGGFGQISFSAWKIKLKDYDLTPGCALPKGNYPWNKIIENT